MPSTTAPRPKDHYSDIEGGLGWWRDTRFATETPKFIMGGVALNFSEWANGPGAGKGRDWKKPAGHYAVAQLSPWVLWPPDGLNLKQGHVRGTLRLRLPAAAAHHAEEDHRGQGRTDRQPLLDPVPQHRQLQRTGDVLHAVLLVASLRREPAAGGLFLDTRPSEPNKAVQMETQHIPAYLSKDAKGDTYARVAPTMFPGKPDGDAVLVHRITAYSKAALWDGVQAWFDGGPAASGEIDPKAADVHTFDGKGGATWQIYPPERREEQEGAARLELVRHSRRPR